MSTGARLVEYGLDVLGGMYLYSLADLAWSGVLLQELRQKRLRAVLWGFALRILALLPDQYLEQVYHLVG